MTYQYRLELLHRDGGWTAISQFDNEREALKMFHSEVEAGVENGLRVIMIIASTGPTKASNQ